MRKRAKAFAPTLAGLALLASLPVAALAAGKFQTVGELNCVFAGGNAPKVVLCEFQLFDGRPLEQYFVETGRGLNVDTAMVQWQVLSLVSAGGYKESGLAGDYLASAGLGVGSLLATGKTKFILQLSAGSIDPGASVFQLRKLE